MTPEFHDQTIGARHYNRVRQYSDRTSILAPWKDGRRVDEFVAYSWTEQRDRADQLGSGLIALDLQPGDRVAIIGENRLRWLDAFYATQICGAVAVTIYPTLTARDMSAILADSGARFAFVSKMEIVKNILPRLEELPALERLIVMDPVGDTDDPVMTFDMLLALGRENLTLEELHRRVQAQQGDDLAVLIYTSGTTGVPKGVMLTQRNLISQEPVLPLFDFNENDIWLSHIPMCHAFGLSGDLLGSGDVGGTLAMAPSVDSDELRWALTTIRPTVLMSVPRLYEKMYLKIQATLARKPAIAQKLFGWAHKIGREMFTYTSQSKQPPAGLRFKFRLADRILAKARKQAGFERLRVAYAGGGPTGAQLVLFFQGLGIQLYQGYGLTETSPVVTVNRPGNNKLGSVGAAIEGAQIKIAEDGEILIKGPMVMKGYWNKPQETAEAFTEDGWLLTGDIGHLDEEGYLFITDRKKEIIVTSGGKNIAPSRIENMFNLDAMVEKVVVIGNDRKFLSALICPNFEALEPWVAERGWPTEDHAQLVKRPEVLELYQKIMHQVNSQLARFETIKKFALMDHVFSEETGEMTATHKVKRRVVDETYKETIDAFYGE